MKKVSLLIAFVLTSIMFEQAVAQTDTTGRRSGTTTAVDTMRKPGTVSPGTRPDAPLVPPATTITPPRTTPPPPPPSGNGVTPNTPATPGTPVVPPITTPPGTGTVSPGTGTTPPAP